MTPASSGQEHWCVREWRKEVQLQDLEEQLLLTQTKFCCVIHITGSGQNPTIN